MPITSVVFIDKVNCSAIRSLDDNALIMYGANIMVVKIFTLTYSLNTADNQLDDLNAAVEILSQMPALKWLDLRGNPFTKKLR